ncbi:MAG: glycosyltransferase [Acetobacterium woodii]|nr:glycosyltransferase [Acetobacterium woodii]
MDHKILDLKEKFKRNISALIENGNLSEAKELLIQYDKIAANEIDVYSIKGVIAMLEGDLSGAECILKKGLAQDETDFDLLFNLGYLYELTDDKTQAIKYYKKSLVNSKDVTQEEDAYNILLKLGLTGKIRDIKDKCLSENFCEQAFIQEADGNKSDAAINYGLAYKYSKDALEKAEIADRVSKNEVLKHIFDVAAKSEKRRFIILSSCGWTDIYQRMHHISRSLAKFGNEVIYVIPSTTNNTEVSDTDFKDINNYSLENIRDVEGVKIYAPVAKTHNGTVQTCNYNDLVQQLLDENVESKKSVIITYTPCQVNTIKEMKGDFFHIYDCVDDHSDMEYAFWGNIKDSVWEQELMDKADAITTTATSLFLQRVAIERKNNVYLSRNAVNEGDFPIDDKSSIPEDLIVIPEPRIVYTGAIYEWFDKELFYSVVKANPEKSFVIIGFGDDKVFSEKYDNLFLLGPKKHSELKRYLNNCQVAIIPFKDGSDLVINCDPIKQYEYIAVGLPVVATYMPEVAIGKINTLCANTVEAFNQAIERCLKLEIDDNAITEFLIENSWNERAALLCDIADINRKSLKKSGMRLNLKKELDTLCNNYESPVFDALKGVYFNLHDSLKFEEYLSRSYMKQKNRYIERQYLTALYLNKKLDRFTEVLKDSRFINNELSDELQYVRNNSRIPCLEIVLNLCLGRIRTASLLTQKIKDLTIMKGYQAYINILLDEMIFDIEINNDIFTHHSSAFANFIMEKQIVSESKIQVTSKEPFISVIIPTRNSAEILKYALKTCIEQNYDNYEIIVSDNSSPGNDDTRKMVAGLNSDKICYFRTPEEYAMMDNFEYAYNQANGEYMIVIGSDDGLLLHCLDTLAKIIIELDRPLSITWDLIAYGWPGVGINSMKNGLFIPYPNMINNVKCNYRDESILRAVLNFEMRYSALPMFYMNSIIKRELAEEAKRFTGKLFAGSPPDVYTGLVFAYLQKKYLYVNIPMSISGSSEKSIGATATVEYNKDKKSENKLKFEDDRLKEKIDLQDYYVPYFAVEEVGVLTASMMAKEYFSNNDFEINRENFYKASARYLFEDEYFLKKKKELYHLIKNHGNSKIVKWYENDIVNNNEFKGHYNYQNNDLLVGYRENGGLVLDAAKFNASNVYEAAKLYRNIVGY